jgi:hypothetical protein
MVNTPEIQAASQGQRSLNNTGNEPLDTDTIFAEYISSLDTQPLPKITPKGAIPWGFVLFTLLLFLSFVGGTIVALVTYPTVTVTLTPLERTGTLTTPLAFHTRQLSPITLTQSITTPTSGKGHTNAVNARGALLFYNGAFTPQMIYAGTVFTDADGVKVVTDQTETVPPGNPPSYGSIRVAAHAIIPGAAGNILAGDINTPCCSPSILVKNTAFTGGADARDYHAVAQGDRDRLIAPLRKTLARRIQRAFPLQPTESIYIAACTFTAIPNHHVGDEANALTLTAKQTCRALAYNKDQLTRAATAVFTAQTRPDPQYELVGTVKTTIEGGSPFTVSCSGLWVYSLSQDYERYLAERIAGDNSEQAKAYLLKTGLITHVTITQDLPKDPDYIHFQVVVLSQYRLT